jgi:hypothetical protein
VPPEVLVELQRVVRRWQQLPLDHALGCMPPVRQLLAELAGSEAPDVPDLGPAVVMDQLTVLVYDACEGAGPGPRLAPQVLAERLRELRRALS